MATKGKSKSNQSAVAAITLAMIVTAGAEGLMTSAAVHNPLVEAGMVEINPGITNEAGEVATRATQQGIDSMNMNTGATPTPTPAAAAVKSAFKLDDAVELPTIKRGGRGGNVYPFDEMSKGQSFFVAATADKPDPAKSLASTVSSATARYAVEVAGETEEVEVKTYQLNDAGKRVKRDGSFVVLSTAVETRLKMAITRQFVVRSVEEGGVKGARVWRTA